LDAQPIARERSGNAKPIAHEPHRIRSPVNPLGKHVIRRRAQLSQFFCGPRRRVPVDDAATPQEIPLTISEPSAGQSVGQIASQRGSKPTEMDRCLLLFPWPVLRRGHAARILWRFRWVGGQQDHYFAIQAADEPASDFIRQAHLILAVRTGDDEHGCAPRKKPASSPA